MTTWRTVPMGDDYVERNGIYVPPQHEAAYVMDASAFDNAIINGLDDAYASEYLNATYPPPQTPVAEPPKWNLGEDVITIPDSDYAWKD